MGPRLSRNILSNLGYCRLISVSSCYFLSNIILFMSWAAMAAVVVGCNSLRKGSATQLCHTMFYAILVNILKFLFVLYIIWLHGILSSIDGSLAVAVE
uniref:Uncharacterized protein n=1 Tax=Arundo donax TaxID=35708 RepID=A0A0A9GWN1_ARUDO